jgi:hypothetical protein
MNLEQQLRRHYGSLRPGADFDARVLARIANSAHPAGDPAARRAAELAGYERTRKRVARDWLQSMGWIAVFGIIAMLLVPHAIPVATQLTQASARALGAGPLPGMSLGELLVLVVLAAWFAVRQPRIASRW